MSLSNTPTAHAVSPDSGEHWTAEGAWQVAPGLWRIPLPLPMDGLKAINVYVLETDTGLTLVEAMKRRALGDPGVVHQPVHP